MIVKTEDPELINRIANSDGVREFIDFRDNGEGLLDFTAACGRVTQTGVVWLTNGEDAVAAFELTGERLYEAHTMFAETCRGRRAVTTGKDMVTWMFDHGADAVWGATPHDNRKAKWFNRQLGAVPFAYNADRELFMIRKAA